MWILICLDHYFVSAKLNRQGVQPTFINFKVKWVSNPENFCQNICIWNRDVCVWSGLRNFPPFNSVDFADKYFFGCNFSFVCLFIALVVGWQHSFMYSLKIIDNSNSTIVSTLTNYRTSTSSSELEMWVLDQAWDNFLSSIQLVLLITFNCIFVCLLLLRPVYSLKS